MEYTPKVSVIMPVYNAEKYLSQCLNSVVNQTLKDIEIICVDDGSIDKSLEILQEYSLKDNRLKIVCQQNRGAGAARNNGMILAKGKYLYFMDSDDYCELDFFAEATKEAEKKQCDILVFNYNKFDEESGAKEYRNGLVQSRYPKDKETFSYKDIPQYICKTVNPTPWNKLYLHDFVKESKLQWEEISTTNDITFATMSVLMAGRIAYLDRTFYNYRVSVKNSITSKKKYKQDNVIQAVLSVAKQSSKLSYFDEIKNAVREFVASNLILALQSYTPDDKSAYHFAFSKKIEAIFYSHPLFLGCADKDFQDKNVYSYFESARERARARDDHSYSPKIIASLTSFPGRINSVYISLNSIFKQTKKPDKVILWLAESQFPNKEEDLPIDLLDYKSLGLEIEWCPEDIRPHKKYFYAMQKYPDDIIITFDDDLIYEPHIIDMLFHSYLQYPNAVSAIRTHLIMPDDKGNIASYHKWIKEFSGIIAQPSMQLFSTSGAGTLYPPYCMDEEVFNINNIKSLSLKADDIWLKIMQIKKGTPVVLVKNNRNLKYVSNTQEEALQNSNVYNNENDVQLNKLLSEYETNRDISNLILCDGYNENSVNNGEMLFQDIFTKRNSIAYIELEQQIKTLKAELYCIKKSVSFRIGRGITFIPRKIRGGIKCYKDNGLKYTIYRFLIKIIKFLKR